MEDSVEEGKVVGDFLIAIHMKAILGLKDRGAEVRHEFDSEERQEIWVSILGPKGMGDLADIIPSASFSQVFFRTRHPRKH